MHPPEKELNVRKPVGKVRRNIDYGEEMFKQLEEAAQELNISSQALTKMALKEWLDRHQLAKDSREKSK